MPGEWGRSSLLVRLLPSVLSRDLRPFILNGRSPSLQPTFGSVGHKPEQTRPHSPEYYTANHVKNRPTIYALEWGRSVFAFQAVKWKWKYAKLSSPTLGNLNLPVCL